MYFGQHNNTNTFIHDAMVIATKYKYMDRIRERKLEYISRSLSHHIFRNVEYVKNDDESHIDILCKIFRNIRKLTEDQNRIFTLGSRYSVGSSRNKR